MKYNLLPGALWSVNLTEGNTDISFEKLTQLVEYGDDPVVELGQDNVLVLDFDLGTRVNLDSFEYKFETSYAPPAAVVSGIEFSYKDENFETIYTSLATYISEEPNVYKAVASGTGLPVWGPRYLKVKHDLGATYGVTTISGFLYGAQVLNDDTIVDFGQDGSMVETSIEVARGGFADIKELAIYNSGYKIADALLNIVPNYTGLDDVIAISNSPDGPWTKPLDPDTLVFNSATYSYGTYVNTQSSYGNIRIVGWDDINQEYTSYYTYATYMTRVFYKAPDDHMLLIIDKVLPMQGRLAVDATDATETIEVRATDTPPKDYACIREVRAWYTPYTHYYGYRDRWSETFDIREDSSQYFATTGRYTSLNNYQVTQDPLTERWAGWFTSYGTDYRAYADLYLFNNIGSTTKNYRLSYQSAGGAYKMNSSFREIKITGSGGVWIYFYCQGYHSGDFANQTGFYLGYFDKNLNNLFKWYVASEQIQDMDVDYEYNYVWYTRPESNAIYKLNTAGDVLVNYIDADGEITNELGGLAVLGNSQGIWFGNDKALHRLDNEGHHLPEFTIEDVAVDYLKYIVLDGDGSEALWLLDGFTVGRFIIAGDRKGTYDFRVTLTYPVRLESTDTGVWVYCVDLADPGKTYLRFISKVNKREENSYSPSGTSRPGPIEFTYEHPTYTDKLPINTDDYWTNLAWNKVAIEGYLSPEARYYQARLTFRRQEPIERYPEFITDPTQPYIYRDDFVQDDPTPKQILWGSWDDMSVDDGHNRVYVDTAANELIMVPDWGSSTGDAWIRTKSRLVTARDASPRMEVRIKYRFGEGNVGVASGRSEYIYLYGFAMDEDKAGNYVGAYLYIPPDPVTSNVYVYARVNSYSGWAGNSRGMSLGYYEGTLRIYAETNDYLYGQVASGPTSTSFAGTYSRYWKANGTRWYWQIVSNRNSTQVAITDFEVRLGNNYYYTDTPKVNAMYTQELVQVDDIHPQSYKNAYIRTQVPTEAELNADYESDVKVRWRTPIY